MTAGTQAQLGSCAVEVSRDELVDLLCADEEWLRREFDALVAASWGRPALPGRGASGPRGGGENDHRCDGSAAAPAGTDAGPVAGRSGRSRSPPSRG